MSPQQTFPTRVAEQIDQLVKDLRSEVQNNPDPQAKALYETSAEVLIGLGKAFQHYQEQSEQAWKP